MLPISSSTFVIGLLGLTGLASNLLAQSPAKARSPGPTASKAVQPSPSASSPRTSDPSYQRDFALVQDLVGKASGEVTNRILQAENDLYIRFAYFKKPERLDPNSFATKDELASWEKSLNELKDRAAAVSRLYANADIDLQNALVAQRIPPQFADQIKKQLLKSFPWDAIKKKEQLMQDYVADHGELLAFYNKNWGTWKKGDQPLKPVFDNPELGTSYGKLRDKIVSTGNQIQDQFAALGK